MKKLMIGLLAAFLMTTGLVAFTAPTASAAGPCPYSGCVATNTVGVGSWVPGSAPRKSPNARKNRNQKGYGKIAAVVDGVGTNVEPVGRVYLTVKKKGSTRIKYRDSANVDQRGKVKFIVPNLKKRPTWVYKVAFYGNQRNGWKSSRDIGSFSGS